MAQQGSLRLGEKSLERKLLLQKCFSRRTLHQIGLTLGIPYFRSLDNPWQTDEDRGSFEISSRVTDKDLADLFTEFKPYEWVRFAGRYYTVEGGKLSFEDSWKSISMGLKESRLRYGVNFTRLLKLLLTMPEGMGPSDILRGMKQLGFKGPDTAITGILDDLSRRGIVQPTYYGVNYKEWGIPDELLPLLREHAEGPFTHTRRPPKQRPPLKRGLQPKPLAPDVVEDELKLVKTMDGEFTTYLTTVLDERLEETVNFGERMNAPALCDYLLGLFGPVLYFDSVLALAQQYGLADVEIVTSARKTGLRSGFNLSLFGEPGTGKSFATRDLILGSPKARLPPHGLPGRNRYAGGITAARFIRIGPAYEGRVFNFIVPEFNDWFKYRGMVEPLKLAMERGEILYETHREAIGPYRFTSFFSVNYNTEVSGKGYQATISDPNFEAIEDRMLCRLHRLTKERYVEIARSQMKLALTRTSLRSKAQSVRDHLTLLHAIETRHPKVKRQFDYKPILVTRETFEEIEKARNAILNRLSNHRVPFSARLEDRALRLAASLSLIGYFQCREDRLPISKDALKLALRFYVEEACIRSGETFDSEEVVRELS